MYPQIALWVSIIYLIIPFRYFFRSCEGNISRDDGETYTKKRIEFLTDYGRSNPVTSKEATLEHLTLLEKQEKSEEERTKLHEQFLQVKKGGNFSGLLQYAQSNHKEVPKKLKNRFIKNDGFRGLTLVSRKSGGLLDQKIKSVMTFPNIKRSKVSPLYGEALTGPKDKFSENEDINDEEEEEKDDRS